MVAWTPTRSAGGLAPLLDDLLHRRGEERLACCARVDTAAPPVSWVNSPAAQLLPPNGSPAAANAAKPSAIVTWKGVAALSIAAFNP